MQSFKGCIGDWKHLSNYWFYWFSALHSFLHRGPEGYSYASVLRQGNMPLGANLDLQLGGRGVKNMWLSNACSFSAFVKNLWGYNRW